MNLEKDESQVKPQPGNLRVERMEKLYSRCSFFFKKILMHFAQRYAPPLGVKPLQLGIKCFIAEQKHIWELPFSRTAFISFVNVGKKTFLLLLLSFDLLTF